MNKLLVGELGKAGVDGKNLGPTGIRVHEGLMVKMMQWLGQWRWERWQWVGQWRWERWQCVEW